MAAWMTPARWAALTYALAAVTPIGSWLLLMFYAAPTNRPILESALGSLKYTLTTPDSNQWWFIGWAVLPIYLLILSAAYLSPLVVQRRWALGLLGAAAVAALYCLFAVPPLGVILLLALYPSYRCIHGA